MSIEKYTTEAIILNIYDQGENDRVYKMFTYEFGLVMAHGKSIRKLESKLRSHLMVGRTVLVTLVKGREVWRITGATDISDKNVFLHEIASVLNRFIQGEGAHKNLYKNLISISKNFASFDKTKAKLLIYFVVLVDLGYADHKMIGSRDVKEYFSFDVNDLYTHLLLNYENIKKHVSLVIEDTHL